MESKYSCLKSVLENEQLPSPESRMKRKFRTSLTVKNKLEVIEYATINPNATQSKIASHFGIDRTTVSKVLKRRADILTYADQFNESSSELMCTSLMKKGSPSREGSSSPNITKKSSNNGAGNSASGNRSKPRPLLPKGELKGDNPNISQRKSGKSLTASISLTDLKGEVYHPELTTKCESWFMEQNLSPNKNKKGPEHIANIRAFSKLLSVIPLSDSECYKILAGKCVRDACLTFIKKVAQELILTGRSIGSRSYELLHRFLLEGMPELDLDRYYCYGFTAFEADDVKRIWVKYVQPKLQQLYGDNSNNNGLSLPPMIPQDRELTVQVTPEQAPDINDNSEECQLYPISGELAIVRGSRKRKMNSKPMKMVAVDSNGNDQNIDGFDHDDTQEETEYVLNQATYVTKEDIIQNSIHNHYNMTANTLTLNSPNENIAPENLVVPNKKRRSNGKVPYQERANGNAQDLTMKKNPNDFPVIEIKPDGCSDEEIKMPKIAAYPNVTGNNSSVRSDRDSLDNSSLVSFTNATHLILAYTKSLEERINKMETAKSEVLMNNNKKDKMFETNLADNIMKKCNESMKQVMNSFTDQVSQLANNDQNKSGCTCQCTQLKERVESLENKIDTLQGSFDKLYEAVMASK